MEEKRYIRTEVAEALAAFDDALTPQSTQIVIPLSAYIGKMVSLIGDNAVIKVAENFTNAVQSIRFVTEDFRSFCSPFIKACIEMRGSDLRTAKIIIDCASGIIATEKDCEKIIAEVEYAFLRKAKSGGGLNALPTHPIYR